MFTTEHRLLVACSGGVDSMVLCHLLQANGFSFHIAHCNFKLRGADSDSDEAFVRDYADRESIPFHIIHFDTEKYAAEHKLSIQVAAREMRYAWFYELLPANQLDFLLTAHHADDNTETVLMNLFKGTGIQGLRGILPKQKRLVRPLLFADKKQIVTYAKTHGVHWREDVSNGSNKYTRNYFRNIIIPQIEQVVPNASANIHVSINHFSEVELLYKQAIDVHRKQLLQLKGEEVHIPVLKLAAVVPFDTIAFELFRPYGFNAGAITDLKQLLKADTGKYIASASHRIIKNRKWLIVAPLYDTRSANVVIDADDDKVLFEEGTLLISKVQNHDIIKDAMVALIDAACLTFPLLLRKWKAGDYFYPLGMPKKKKVARFLIDQKMSQTQKEKTWVLVSNNKIIWVVGCRIDDRFKITSSTKEVLKFRLVAE